MTPPLLVLLCLLLSDIHQVAARLVWLDFEDLTGAGIWEPSTNAAQLTTQYQQQGVTFSLLNAPGGVAGPRIIEFTDPFYNRIVFNNGTKAVYTDDSAITPSGRNQVLSPCGSVCADGNYFPIVVDFDPPIDAFYLLALDAEEGFNVEAYYQDQFVGGSVVAGSFCSLLGVGSSGITAPAGASGGGVVEARCGDGVQLMDQVIVQLGGGGPELWDFLHFHQPDGGDPAGDDCTEVEAALAECLDARDAALGEFVECDGDLGDCINDFGQCSGELADCTNAYDQCSGEFSGCTDNYGQCSGELAECTDGYVQCSGELAGCTDNYDLCSVELANCTNELAGCVSDLADTTLESAQCADALADEIIRSANLVALYESKSGVTVEQCEKKRQPAGASPPPGLAQQLEVCELLYGSF